MSKTLPLVLMILDGWGYSEKTEHNAIKAANTPQWDEWWSTRPHALLEASGLPVGLPDAQMGNSEVGHMHIGAGRVILQDYTRINAAIQDGSYASNPVFIKTVNQLKQHDHALHIMGLLSPGGVHSHEDHLFAFLKFCHQQQFTRVYLHLFLDGRDTSPQSALTSIKKLKEVLKQYPVATINSITGRYYAMDRDNRWQRMEPVYRMLTEKAPTTLSFNAPEDAIEYFYQQNIYDEFIPPTCIGDNHPIQDDDAVFFLNFRADRARQLTQTFVEDSFTGFTRTIRPKITLFISMTAYSKTLNTEVAFPCLSLKNTLGEIISQHHLRQLRLAETEKYAHVTFFLNGGSERIFPNEDRILIHSPAVATYDMQPEMSATQLTKTIVEAIEQQRYDVIICNYANADMVGHSGNFQATVQAIECLDKAMHTIWQTLSKAGGQLLITADHGNAESMYDEHTHQAHTAHTSEPVPLIYVGDPSWHMSTHKGSLIDIAPTVLTLLGIIPPIEMTGRCLLAKTS